MRSFSFKKKDRILKRRDFLILSASGEKVYNRHFIALFYPSETEITRLGITITKKVGKAVKRNRLKRLIREYFRLNKHIILYKADISIIVKKTACDLKYIDIFIYLEDIFQKVSKYFD